MGPFLSLRLLPQDEHTQRESAHLVATVAEKEREEEEKTQKDNQCTHLTVYTRIAVEFIIKQSEPRFTEIPTSTDSEEKSSKKEDSEEESHTEEANQDRKSDPVEEDTEEQTTKANPKEGSEAMEDKKKQTHSSSNIKRAFKTMVSAVWPKQAKKKPFQRFLSRTTTKHKNP